MPLIQLVEHWFPKPDVGGSSPSRHDSTNAKQNFERRRFVEEEYLSDFNSKFYKEYKNSKDSRGGAATLCLAPLKSRSVINSLILKDARQREKSLTINC